MIDADVDRRVTYGELQSLVEHEASRLTATLPAGEAIFLFPSATVTSVVRYLAARHAGFPLALLAPFRDADRERALVHAYDPCALVRDGSPVTPSQQSLDRAGVERVHPALSLMLSTSGSTGSPKLVRLSRRAVEANAKAIAHALDIGPGDVAPTTLPLYYSYGLSVLNSHLAVGATVLLTQETIASERFWTACREYEATSFAGVPFSYELLSRLDVQRLAPASLLTFTQAGGRMSHALVQRFHELARARGGRLFVMYGQTEATARIAILPPSELPHRAGSVGKAIPGGTIGIHIDGREARERELGEVVYTGPNVMMGYANHRRDLSRDDECHGVLRTGDLGFLDEQSFLWITGRLTRVGKVFGNRVNLDDIEQIIREQAGVLNVAAVGAGDRVRIFMECLDSARTVAIRAMLSNHTGLNQSGFIIVTVKELPRTPVGKVDYAALQDTTHELG